MDKEYQSITLKDKVIVITGGYGYLGEGIAKSMRANGALVYILGRDEQKFISTFDDDEIHFVSCDISSSESIQNAIQQVSDTAGRIDSIVNNAFYASAAKNQENIEDEVWDHSIDGTLSSVHRCIKSAIPHLKESKGNIINVSSMYGIVAPDFSIYASSPESMNPAFYGAAKAAVVQLTKYYASLLGQYQIRVNAVSPGPFPNKQVQENESFVQSLKNKTSLGRIGTQKDIGGPFVFLASEAASFVSGHNLVVDGGWTIT